MSDKITKFLRKLSPKELAKVSEYKERIEINDLSRMNIKKLVGHDTLFRARLGRIRIIFEKIDDECCEIKMIDFRDDKTYRDF
jgi:mRNA-degrading endonuclease RelE of RelBE toxin-antitoxin system